MYTVKSTTNLNGFHVAPILRLHVEIGGMFADNMDLLSMTRWRLTCKANYDQTVASFRRSLITMMNTIVPKPAAILTHVSRHRAVLGGEFALAFLLRDHSLLPVYLDIYTSDYEFPRMCSSILSDSAISSAIQDHDYISMGLVDAMRYLVSRTLVITTSLGTKIRIHRSYTSSATAPLTHAPSTALSNFVTEYGFGCSHPILTFHRRALIGDQELPYLPVADSELHDRLMDHGFSLTYSPTAWPEFRRGPLADVRRSRVKALIHCAEDGDGADPCLRTDTANGAEASATDGVPDATDVDGSYVADTQPLLSNEQYSPLPSNGVVEGIAHEDNAVAGGELCAGFALSPGVHTSGGDHLSSVLYVHVEPAQESRAEPPFYGGAASSSNVDHVQTQEQDQIPRYQYPSDDRRASPVDRWSERSTSHDGLPLDEIEKTTAVRRGEYHQVESAESLLTGIEAVIRYNPTRYLQRSLYMGEFTGIPSPDHEHRHPHAADHTGHPTFPSVGEHDHHLNTYYLEIPSNARYTFDLLERTAQSIEMVPVEHQDMPTAVGSVSRVTTDCEIPLAIASPHTVGTQQECHLESICIASLEASVGSTSAVRRTEDFGTTVAQADSPDDEHANPAVYTEDDSGISYDDRIGERITGPVLIHLASPDPEPTARSDLQIAQPQDPDSESGSESTDDGDYMSTEADEDRPIIEECWRPRFVCPSQGRFFGDRGSFVEFFDPLRGGEQHCATNSIAPFRPMVVWHVLSTFNCEEGCDLYDDALDAGILPIPIVARDPDSVNT